jgi:hypothetical protein
MRVSAFRQTAFLAIALAGLGSTAQAQYGGYGWGGWGGSSTIGGDVARGMGVYAAGAGQYNVDTAQARSINSQTMMNYNEYLYESIQIAHQNYYKKVAARKERNNVAIQELEQRHLYQPTREDVVSGDALNAILVQLGNPSLPSSLLDNAATDMKLAGEQIKLIPLKFAQRGVIVSIDRLSVADGWPGVLQGDAFKPLRDRYMAIVQEAKELPEDQTLPDAKITEAIAIIGQMQKLALSLGQSKQITSPDYAAAERFLKPLAGMLQAARQPDIRKILRQAAEKESIPLANAISFMEVFNLQFGTAKSPEEVALYTQSLYPMLRQLRDRVEGEMNQKLDTPTTQMPKLTAAQGHAATSGVFNDANWDQITRTAPPVEPPPVAEDPNGGARQ